MRGDAPGAVGSPSNSHSVDQPEPSLTQVRAPSWRQAGPKIHSSAPPAMRRDAATSAPSRRPTCNSQPSQGMLGWFHCSQASRLPQSDGRGSE